MIIMIGTILKYVFMAPMIVYTFSNTVKWSRGQAIVARNMWFMGISIAAYCLLEFGLGF